MYRNIEFPEGTKYQILQYCPYDNFTDDYEISIEFQNRWSKRIYGLPNICILPQKNFSKVIEYDINGYNFVPYNYNPVFDLSGYHIIQIPSTMFYSIDIQTHLVFDGNLSESLRPEQNASSKLEVVYYNNEFRDTLYPNLANAFPNAQIIPYGDVNVSLKVLRNGEWMSGEQLYFNNRQMEYRGKGVYETTVHQLPRERFNYVISDGVYKTSYNLGGATQINFGDNSNLTTTYVGNEINEIITDNQNGWYYSITLGGFRNNDIKGTSNGSTTMTIIVPSNSIDIVYGQSSEKNYDFLSILDSKNVTLFSSKGLEGDNFNATVSSDDGIFIFKYSKDGSGDKGEDACWIKSISFSSLPPLPED